MQPGQPQAESQGQPPEGGQDPLTQMATQTDQALSKLAQVIGQKSPEAGQALQQIGEQFRQVMEKLMGGGSQGGRQPAPEMASPETQGRPGTAPSY